MTVREALQLAKARLLEAGFSPSQADAEARQLLGWLVGPGAALWRSLEWGLGEGAARTLTDALRRRILGEPLQMIIGSVEFYGLRLMVRPGVLVPRPETELLVEKALEALKGVSGPRVLDAGTGSGAVALAIKSNRPNARVYAGDVSRAALALAAANAKALGLGVVLVRGSLTAGLRGLDLLVSNPPYLPRADAEAAPPELRWEPAAALYAGEDGLGVALPLLEAGLEALRPGGRLLLELDPRNVSAAAARARSLGYHAVRTCADLAGRERYLSARRG